MEGCDCTWWCGRGPAGCSEVLEKIEGGFIKVGFVALRGIMMCFVCGAHMVQEDRCQHASRISVPGGRA